MINNLQISAVYSQLTDKERDYARKKIGKLDRYIPRRARQSTFVDVKLKDTKAKNKLTYECEVVMKLPKSTITTHKAATTINAAIDMAEDNLKVQLKKYKDLHDYSRLRRHTLARLKRRFAAGNSS